jgi:hypothetical protein
MDLASCVSVQLRMTGRDPQSQGSPSHSADARQAALALAIVVAAGP